jgi:hypothetical protein
MVLILDLMSSTDLTDLAWDLASDGFVGRENAVRQVVRTARVHGVPAALTAVLADPGQPEVARLRAFGRISTLLATPQRVGRVTRAA